MTFTYLGTGATDLDKVRFEIQDTASASALFTDEEINAKLTEHADVVLLAAADLCGVLARRYGQQASFSTDGQSFKLGERAEMWRQLASDLLAKAGAGATLGVIETSREDGYSEREELRGSDWPFCEDDRVD